MSKYDKILCILETVPKRVLIACALKMNNNLNKDTEKVVVDAEDIWAVKTVNTGYRQENIDGIKFSVYKSAIQKFLRRNMCSLGLGTLKIMRNFDDSTPNGKKICSNIMNRMIVMMSEEININNPKMPEYIHGLYIKFLEDRDYNHIYKIYANLCNSKKCRIPSDIKVVYHLPPYFLNKQGEVDISFHKNLVKDDPRLLSVYDITLDKDETLGVIYKLLTEGSYDAFLYLSHYAQRNYTEKRGTQELWKVIIKACRDKSLLDSVNALKYFYTKMTHKEATLYIYHAMLTVIHQDSLKDEPFEDTSDDMSFVYPMTNGKFPDYIYDIHTGHRTKTIIDFAVEGALVENECSTYLDPRLREYYIQSKKMIHDIQQGYTKTKSVKSVKSIKKKTKETSSE